MLPHYHFWLSQLTNFVPFFNWWNKSGAHSELILLNRSFYWTDHFIELIIFSSPLLLSNIRAQTLSRSFHWIAFLQTLLEMRTQVRTLLTPATGRYEPVRSVEGWSGRLFLPSAEIVNLREKDAPMYAELPWVRSRKQNCLRGTRNIEGACHKKNNRDWCAAYFLFLVCSVFWFNIQNKHFLHIINLYGCLVWFN